jgi:hypothetical protein
LLGLLDLLGMGSGAEDAAGAGDGKIDEGAL